MATNLNLLRSRLESKQKELVEVLEQLKTSLKHPKDGRQSMTTGNKRKAAGVSSEVERCLALEKQIKKKLDGLVHALHMLEEVK